MLVFVDSFDHYGTSSDVLRKWGYAIGTTPTISSGTGRGGSSSLRFPFQASGFHVRHPLPTPVQTLIMGVAVRIYANGYPQNPLPIHRFLDPVGANEQISLRLTNQGYLQVSRNGSVLATSSITLEFQTYYYIEFAATISNTTGSYRVRVDGQPVPGLPDVTNVNTQGQANDQIGFFGLGTTSSIVGTSSGIDFDDLYVCDTSGDRNNNLLGDVRIICRTPDGNGDSSDFIGSDGDQTDNYALVDETTPSLADYVASVAASATDTYTLSDLETAGAIKGVQVTALAGRSDGGVTRYGQTVIVSGATEAASEQTPLSTDPRYIYGIFETDPSTGSPWTVSGVNDVQIGFRATTD